MPSANPLRHIHDFPGLKDYLENELAWPLDQYTFDELTFDYTPEEVGLKEADAAKIRDIRQLRPLRQDQPWGIFFVEFEKKKLPVVVLRRILNHLVVKKRASANRADARRWETGDILFISAFGDTADQSREIAFAHFQQEPGDLPTLRVLGWDGGDTVLHLDHVAKQLKERLRWPDVPSDAPAWRDQWRKPFRHRIDHTIKTAADLAQTLAALARNIRDAARMLMAHESERGALHKLFTAFQAALIHDLTPETFADTYAQTITYGLLTAAISRTEMSEGTRGTVVLAENITDMVPVTNPFLKEMLQTFLQAGGRRGGLDFDELGVAEVVELLRGDDTDLPAILRDFGNRTRGEDPVIHFYEHFLSAYNKKLKVERGVFYTPQPVVSYIVRSVHELLRTEFGLVDGLADTATWGEMILRQPGLNLPDLSHDPGNHQPLPENEPFVQILDPATGTGTFLVEVIDVIHQTLTAKWQQQGLSEAQRRATWNDYVPNHLLPRLHAFELMMAPYAIAHMKIGLKLAETGYKFGTEERARIYLTNALEPKVTQLPQIGFDALAHEAEAVNEIKWKKRFTVVIGNPPYAGISSNMTETAQCIVNAYKFVDGRALNERKLWLQDDYVKFIRKAQETIESTRVGILGFITNNGYIGNPTFRGMRQSLMETFPCLQVLDLHGNANKREQSPDGSEDKNVFDIRQGVSICLATRGGKKRIFGSADLWGSRETKYRWLDKHSVDDTGFSPLTPDSPYYFFAPQNTDGRAEYNAGWKISEAMPVNSAGFITARDHFVTDFDPDVLLARIASFANSELSDAEIRATYFAGCGSEKYLEGDTRGWKVPSARAKVQSDKKWRERIVRCLYRPFDFRYVYWADWMVDWPRPEVMGQMLGRNNRALLTARSNKASGTDHFFCTAFISETKCAEYSTQSAAFPLYTFQRASTAQQGLLLEDERQPNLAPGFLREMASALNLPQTQPYGLPAELTPEDIFHYTYAIFHSSDYRSRYAEFLKIDFPRLPLINSLELFLALARLGGELTALHLLESPTLDHARTIFIGGLNPTVENVSHSRETVWIDKIQSIGFQGVPKAVWDFHIGGYQVCGKWLKDRKGRRLSAEEIAHYHKTVVALSETIRLMADIDAVIDQHGGWPGAFQTATAVA